METLYVKTPTSEYPIYWQKDGASFHLILKNFLEKKDFYAITDKNVYKFYYKNFHDIFNQKLLVLPSGEKTKSFFYLKKLCTYLLEKGAHRKSWLVAWGGGVVGDLTGFTAAIYMRGIPYIQIPTTLLSMVDSSVGGKTAINLKDGKNMVGAFWQPQAVFMNVNFLKTLPEKERKSGLSEVIKSAVIQDPLFLDFIISHKKEILSWDPEVLEQLSLKSVKVKAAIVEEDEREVSGQRAKLNFGHTLAHALETYLGYRHLTHGECVAIGMAFAAYLSMKMGLLAKDKFSLFFSLLGELNLPRHFQDVPKKMKMQKILAIMKKDKKNYQKDIQMVLLKDLGHCLLPQPVPEREVEKALHDFASYGKDLYHKRT